MSKRGEGAVSVTRGPEGQVEGGGEELGRGEADSAQDLEEREDRKNAEAAWQHKDADKHILAQRY